MISPVAALANPARLSELHDLLRLEDVPEELLDQLVVLASRVLHAPVCIVSLVDETCERILSSTGLPDPWSGRRELPLEYSYCQFLLRSERTLLIEDARKHEWVRDSPATRDLRAIAYAGVPLRGSSGRVLGGLCVVDHVPRSWMADEVQMLERFASVASADLAQWQMLRGEERRRQMNAQRFETELSALARFRTLVEGSLAGIYLLQGSRILYANPRMREVFGLDPEQPLDGLRVADLVAEEDRARVLENIRRRMQSGGDGPSYNFRGLRRDGTTVEVEVYGSCIEMDGQVAIIGTLLDITKRKRAEERLRESEERLRLVERATEDVIWEWCVRTGVVRWNEAGAKIFRYMPKEVEPSIEWHHEHIHADDRERVVRRLQSTLGGVGEFWSDEYRFLRGDGQYATVVDRGIVVRNERGEPVRVLGSMMDVTERKREEEAQRFLARASALIDRSLDHEATLPALARLCVPLLGDCCLIHLLDEPAQLRTVAAAHVDPTEEDRLVRTGADGAHAGWMRTAATVLRTEEALFLPECTEESLARVGYSAEESEALRALGICSLVAAPLLLGSRKVGAIVVGATSRARAFTPVDLMHVQDLAHRLALSVDHARLYREATQAVRARDEVLAVVSHDLRNPLNAIQMSATMLRDVDQERRAENQRWLDLILKTGEQMNALIGDLLDLSSIEASRFAVEASEQSVEALVGDASTLLEPLAASKGLRLETEIVEDLSTVWIDSGQTLRVISNLVGNAIKFTPEGGTVKLTVTRQQQEALFSISDTGPGIAPEQLPHVFDRYWQARPGDRRGAGLGLAIARGIVEAHGGRIWVQSPEGEGATFCFTVPLEKL